MENINLELMQHVFLEIQKTDRPYPIQCSNGENLYAIYKKKITFSKISSYMLLYKKENFNMKKDFHYEICFNDSKPTNILSRDTSLCNMFIEYHPICFLSVLFPLSEDIKEPQLDG